MLKLKKYLIPGACLVAVIAILFGRSMIFKSEPSKPHQALSGRPSANDIITVHYHERAPYYVTGSNGVYGLCAEPCSLVFKKAGIPFSWKKTPSKRQMNFLKQNSGKICLIGWFKKPEREEFAKYTFHIYQDKPAIALSRADNKNITSGGSLEETISNPNLAMLKKDGYSYGRFIDEKIAEFNPMQEITTAENMGMLKMIHSGRADYFFIAEEEVKELIASSGIPSTDFKYIKFSDMPEGNKRYLLFSMRVEDEVINKVNAAIRKYLHVN